MARRFGPTVPFFLSRLGLALMGCLSALAYDGGAAASPEPPRFFYRVHADVTFDGKPYTIDKWVACNAKGFYSPSRGDHWGYQVSVGSLGVHTAGGGALFIKTPDLCRLAWSQEKALEAGDPNSSPLSDVAAPSDHLPEFYWVNDADNPTEAEAYLSDAYFQRPDRRLTIDRLDVGSVSLEIPHGVEIVDFGEKLPDPYDHCELLRPYAAHYPRKDIVCLSAFAAYPYSEEEWRLSPGLTGLLETAPKDRPTPITRELWRASGVSAATTLNELNRLTTWEAGKYVQLSYHSGVGLPRLEDTSSGRCESMLIAVPADICRGMRLFDEVRPVTCKDAVCEIPTGEKGVFFFRDYHRPYPDSSIDVMGERIPLPTGAFAGWYDPTTRTVWWVTDQLGL